MHHLRSLLIACLAGGAVVTMTAAPAMADSQVTVRGGGFPDGALAELSMVGCSALYDRTTEPLQPFIGRGPAQAPLGQRSRGFDLQGGNAVGPLFYLDSMVDTTIAEMAVHATSGAEGVAYAGYQERIDTGSPDVWIGRTSLTAPAGAWERVQAPTLTYVWTKYDMDAHRPLPEDSNVVATVPEFAAGHGGDGQGFYALGFGCDGAAFSMDAWRIGTPGDVTSYDLEGLSTTTRIGGSAHQVHAGDAVTLTGAVRLGRGDRLHHGTLILEAKRLGADEFRMVAVHDAGDSDPVVQVRPDESTVFRWRFVDRPLAEGSVSSWFLVGVLTNAHPPGLPEAPGSTDGPDPEPSLPPAPSPTDPTNQQPSEQPSTPPSESATESAGASPRSEPSEEPTGRPSEPPPTTTVSPAPSGGPSPSQAISPE